MAKKSLADIQADISLIKFDAIDVVRDAKSNKSDYTPEGLQKRYQDLMQRRHVPEQIALARKDIQAWVDGAHAQVRDLRAKAFPTAKDATEQLAAEMAVSRIMNRPNFGIDTVRTAAAEMGATPARSLLIQESVARGIIERGAADGMAAELVDGFRDAQAQAERASTLMHAANAQLNHLERLIEDMDAEPGATERVDVSQLPGADIAY